MQGLNKGSHANVSSNGFETDFQKNFVTVIKAGSRDFSKFLPKYFSLRSHSYYGPFHNFLPATVDNKM